MSKAVKQNIITYAVCLIVAVIGLYYGKAIAGQHDFLRVWAFTNILILLIGVPFLFFQARAGLPDFWDEGVSQKNRLLFPALIGMGFGLLDILVFKAILHPEPYQELPPFLQPFPYSIFLYFSGAFEVEVFYRLIPLTVLLLLGKWFKNGKYFSAFFWAGAILTALREPLEQWPSGSTGVILYALATGFLMNFLQAIWYRRSGFLASLSVRLGHYLFWHILLGVYVEWLEL